MLTDINPSIGIGTQIPAFDRANVVHALNRAAILNREENYMCTSVKRMFSYILRKKTVPGDLSVYICTSFVSLSWCSDEGLDTAELLRISIWTWGPYILLRCTSLILLAVLKRVSVSCKALCEFYILLPLKTNTSCNYKARCSPSAERASVEGWKTSVITSNIGRPQRPRCYRQTLPPMQ